jgi:hypothetical protein
MTSEPIAPLKIVSLFDYGYGFTSNLNDYCFNAFTTAKCINLQRGKVYECAVSKELQKVLLSEVKNHTTTSIDLNHLDLVVTHCSPIDELFVMSTTEGKKQIILACRQNPHPNVQRILHEFLVHKTKYWICSPQTKTSFSVLYNLEGKRLTKPPHFNQILPIMIDITSGLHHLYVLGIYYVNSISLSRISLQQVGDGDDDDVDLEVDVDIDNVRAILHGIESDGIIIVNDPKRNRIHWKEKSIKENDISFVLKFLIFLLSGMNWEVQMTVWSPDWRFDTEPTEENHDISDYIKSVLRNLKTLVPPLYEMINNICMIRSLQQPDYTMKNLHNQFVTIYSNMKREQFYIIFSVHSALPSVLYDLILYYMYSRYNAKLM